MPHIQSIRLVNVHFNNATQFYDDFLMVLEGGNTTYDLENGGGKSLLLQMILQTVLPKSYLRKEKPLSLIFQGGKERTSHVVVEWILETGSPYRYLLTGFCARKRKGAGDTAGWEGSEGEPTVQAAEIEHLNWCVFYNEYQVAGIKTLPLVNETAGNRSYAGFEEVRKCIQQMKQKGLPAEVFDGIERYQRYLSGQQLLTAEWNIIKGINSGENNIESYFRQNATSRKLIENQFVKIIEDVETLYQNDSNQESGILLADTLIEIRSRLNEYLKLKGHMAEYEKIKEYYQEFGQRNEQLYRAFQALEDWRRQGAAIRNWLGSYLTTVADEMDEAQKQFDHGTQSYQAGVWHQKRLEAGLVNYEKTLLLAEKEQLEAERERLAKLQGGLDQQFNHLVALEAYADYRATQEKLLESQRRIEILQDSGDVLTDHYRQAGGRLRFLIECRVGELHTAQAEAERSRGELEQHKDQIQRELVTLSGKEALREDKAAGLGRQEGDLDAQLQALNNRFLDRGEMEACIAPQEFLLRVGEDLIRFEAELVGVAEKFNAVNSRCQELELESVRIEGELGTVQARKAQVEEWRRDYQDQLAELERQAAGLGKKSVAEYRESLEQLLHQENLHQLEKEIELGRMRQKKRLAEEKGYYVPNEALLDLAQQLSAKCEFAQAGIEWLNELEGEDCSRLLHEMPYLPFAVIVDRSSFDRMKNQRLKLEFASDYAIPIVNLESVRKPENQSGEDIYYFCSFAELVINHEAYARYLITLETSQKTLGNEIAAMAARIAEWNVAHAKVAGFLAAFPEQRIASNRECLGALECALTVLHKQRLDFMDEVQRLKKEAAVLHSRAEDLEQLIRENREKTEQLKQILAFNADLDRIRQQLESERKELAAVKNAITSCKEARIGLERQLQLLGVKISELMIESHDTRNSQQQLTGFAVVENELGLAQARAEYQALQEQVSGKVVEEEELRRRIEECHTGMKRLRERVWRDNSEDLEQISGREASGELVTIPDSDQIANVKRERQSNAKNLSFATTAVTQIERKIEYATGQMGAIMRELPSESGAELPSYDSVERYQKEMESTRQLIQGYQEGIDKSKAELEKLAALRDKLIHQAEDYDAFIAREGVTNEGAVAEELMEFRKFEQLYRDCQGEIERHHIKWDDRLKVVQAETAAFVICEPLAELGRISRALSMEQSRKRQEMFVEYLGNLDEQVQKIQDDIRKLESYQQDFMRRCIQRAELVLGQLRKVEALSRIEVYGKRVNMIELQLAEFEEREKQLRMKAHIDAIVKEIGVESALDRKRVAASLASKELLAQIVDLDKAAVRLYKVESLPENSKFYKWEHAIGSEGQNNSLYFVFAACLISFIRMLSVTNTALRTKKVIIADNPFGATSAPYLWEPMFKIMKQNDIQLIAPGHRIPREITAKFGVIYLLNQEILQDGKMRVVVKDVRVAEEQERLRYIDPEQMGLF